MRYVLFYMNQTNWITFISAGAPNYSVYFNMVPKKKLLGISTALIYFL